MYLSWHETEEQIVAKLRRNTNTISDKGDDDIGIGRYNGTGGCATVLK